MKDIAKVELVHRRCKLFNNHVVVLSLKMRICSEDEEPTT